LSLTGPRDVQATPVVTKRALELASDLAHIELTKFRFKIGCAFIGLAVIVFFLGESVFVAKYFAADFATHSWTLTEVLLALGAAFAGKEVVEAFGTAFKTIRDGSAPK